MYGGDNTKIVVYNIKRWLKGGGEIKKTREENNPKKRSTEHCNCDDFFTGIELALSLTLYKFIV